MPQQFNDAELLATANARLYALTHLREVIAVARRLIDSGEDVEHWSTWLTQREAVLQQIEALQIRT